MTIGIIGQKLRILTHESDKCFPNNMNTINNDFRQLIIDDYIGVIAIIICGLIWSTVILMLEIMLYVFLYCS